MKIKRRKARVVRIGRVSIGGNNPVAIQSMAKTKTSEVAKTIKEIRLLESAGCEIVRVAIKDSADAKAIKLIRQGIKIPLVADIHFNWRLAIESIDSGVDKIRLNPGNIYKPQEVHSVVSALKNRGIPLRVGMNSGSVQDQGAKGLSMPEKLVKSALNYIRMVEKLKFYDTVISLKASTVLDTIEAYRRMAKVCDYPLHLGVTATGLPKQGAIKSSIACGVLLSEGIGDTLRISLTDKPEEEIIAGRAILEALELRNFGPQIISCPTCGRCEVNLVKVVTELEKKISAEKFRKSRRPLKIAVMGCVVNGPGEAKEADLGVAFGKKEGLLFKNGLPVRKIPIAGCAEILLKEIKKTHV